jgi:hypothetical protein
LLIVGVTQQLRGLAVPGLGSPGVARYADHVAGPIPPVPFVVHKGSGFGIDASTA